MATRNPVSVLPDPVGEATRTSLPAAMCGQAADCGGVGPVGKRRANQLATAGWKSVSDTLPFHQEVVTVAAAIPPEAVSPEAGGGPNKRSSAAGPGPKCRRARL